jgi:hypothetical protein
MVFQKLHNYMAMSNQTIEVSVFFAGIAAIMTMAALIFAFLWHPLL